MGLQAFLNNLDFSLYGILPICCLVTTLDIKIEFNRENTNRKKCINTRV